MQLSDPTGGRGRTMTIMLKVVTEISLTVNTV